MWLLLVPRLLGQRRSNETLSLNGAVVCYILIASHHDDGSTNVLERRP